MSCTERNTGPLWRDVDPQSPPPTSSDGQYVSSAGVHQHHKAESVCVSCSPSARFIIKVWRWENKRCGGKSGPPSRFTNLWSSFHERRGPRWSSCRTHGCVFAEGVLVVCPYWLVARCQCPPPNLQPLIHTTNCIFSLFLSVMPPHSFTIPLILPNSQSFVRLHPCLECFYIEGK